MACGNLAPADQPPHVQAAAVSFDLALTSKPLSQPARVTKIFAEGQSFMLTCSELPEACTNSLMSSGTEWQAGRQVMESTHHHTGIVGEWL